jgi:hypothetical protein
MGGSGGNNGIWGSPQGGWFKKSRPLFLLGFENQINWQIVFLNPNKQRFSIWSHG